MTTENRLVLRQHPHREYLSNGYDHSTTLLADAECGECGKENTNVLSMVAENSPGEWYGCKLCLECLKTYMKALEGWSGESGEVERVAESARRMFG